MTALATTHAHASASSPPPLLFFLFLPVMWVGVTTLLGLVSGWFLLATRFPDVPSEQPSLILKGQSGSMGFVSMSRILTLEACSSGLRIRLSRLFGPFQRPIFVPWRAIEIERKQGFFGPVARFRFGGSSLGQLKLESGVADSLWRASRSEWPERGPAPPLETSAQALRLVFRRWLLRTSVAAAFFLFAPRLLGTLQGQGRGSTPRGPDLPWEVAIFFPAIVFGIAAVVEWLTRRRQQ